MFKISLYTQIIVKNPIMFNLYCLMFYFRKKKMYQDIFQQLRTIYAIFFF